MFEDIGSKIKTTAQIFCWIGISLSIIFTFIFWSQQLVGSGFICLFVGPIASWISSFALYGFGELIEKTTKILIELHKLNYNLKENNKANNSNNNT